MAFLRLRGALDRAMAVISVSTSGGAFYQKDDDTTAAALLTSPVDADGAAFGTAANPIIVNDVSGGGASTIYSDQQVVTASAVALTTQALINGVTIKAKSTNAGSVFVGGSGVTTTNDGTGNGLALLPGEAISYPVSTTAGIYIIGTLNDVVYVTGA